MYIRVKINSNEIVFNNEYKDNRALIYRTHNGKSQDKLSEETLTDICSLISHMAKELKNTND